MTSLCYNSRCLVWKGAGVDERGGLENRCGLAATVGSNPTPSAEKALALREGFLLSACRVDFLLRVGDVLRLSSAPDGDLLFPYAHPIAALDT